MAPTDPIKKIAEEVLGHKPQKKPAKTSRTLSLRSDNYIRLQKHCRQSGYTVGDLIDKLIEAYLNSVDEIIDLSDDEDKEVG